jgi:hypothetical protein
MSSTRWPYLFIRVYSVGNKDDELLSMLTGAGQRMHASVSIFRRAGQHINVPVSLFPCYWKPPKRCCQGVFSSIFYVFMYPLPSFVKHGCAAIRGLSGLLVAHRLSNSGHQTRP